MSVSVDHELCKVPLNPCPEKTALLFLQVHPEWMSFIPVDVYFLEHVKLDAVTLRKLLDLGVGAWLLGPELIAGEGEDGQPSLSLKQEKTLSYKQRSRSLKV